MRAYLHIFVQNINIIVWGRASNTQALPCNMHIHGIDNSDLEVVGVSE